MSVRVGGVGAWLQFNVFGGVGGFGGFTVLGGDGGDFSGFGVRGFSVVSVGRLVRDGFLVLAAAVVSVASVAVSVR